MAKLLFITQKVDKDDDVLGVYHRWIEKFAQRLDMVYVICLYKGRVELPGNVEVFSLGKEIASSRLKYIFKFYKYIWKIRKKYQTVLVHMNPIYIVLGGLFWKIKRKKIMLWYNHPLGNTLTRLGIYFSDKVFCTSSYSFSAKFGKTTLMPVGIDTDFFIPQQDSSKIFNNILYLGRISPIKNIHVLIEAALNLEVEDVNFKIYIIGSPSSEADKKYEKEIKLKAKRLMDSGKVIFKPGVSNYQVPTIYNASGIFVNMTPTGSFDKTILEAMSCGVLVLVSNKSMESFFTTDLVKLCMFKENNPQDLYNKIIKLLNLPQDTRCKELKKLREVVLEKHSLKKLMDNLMVYI